VYAGRTQCAHMRQALSTQQKFSAAHGRQRCECDPDWVGAACDTPLALAGRYLPPAAAAVAAAAAAGARGGGDGQREGDGADCEVDDSGIDDGAEEDTGEDGDGFWDDEVFGRAMAAVEAVQRPARCGRRAAGLYGYHNVGLGGGLAFVSGLLRCGHAGREGVWMTVR
jgi:hypothetical protein